MSNQALGANTDRLNAAIASAEKALTQRNYGVRARVAMGDERWLVFGKDHKTWRLMVESGQQVNPLADTSRETRVDAVAFLPALLTALREEAAAQALVVGRAAATAEAFVTSLEVSEARSSSNMATKTDVMNTVESLVSKFVYHDRKEDEQLPRTELNRLIRTGEVTVDEIVAKFREGLVETFS